MDKNGKASSRLSWSLKSLQNNDPELLKIAMYMTSLYLQTSLGHTNKGLSSLFKKV